MSDPKFVDELVRCKVCLECYDCQERKPKFLQCHHSFCMRCLNDWTSKLKKSKSGTAITCPTCRQTTEINKKGVSALKDDFIVLKIMAAMDELCQSDSDHELNDKKSVSQEQNGVVKWCKTCMKTSGIYCPGKHEVCTYEEAMDYLKYNSNQNKNKVAKLLGAQMSLNEQLLAFLQHSHQALAGTIIHGIQEQINSRSLNMTMARSKLNMLPSLFPDSVTDTLDSLIPIFEETEKHVSTEQSQRDHIDRLVISKEALQNCKITVTPQSNSLMRPCDTFSIVIDSGGKNSEERALVYLLHKIFNDKGISFSSKNSIESLEYNGTYEILNGTGGNIPYNRSAELLNKAPGGSAYRAPGANVPVDSYPSFSLFNGGIGHSESDTNMANTAITNIVNSNKVSSSTVQTSVSNTVSPNSYLENGDNNSVNVNPDAWQVVDSKRNKSSSSTSIDGKSSQMYSVVAKVNGTDKKVTKPQSKSTESTAVVTAAAAAPRKPTVVLNKELGSVIKKSNCFFEIEVNGTPIGKVTIKLRHDTAPKMCANFVALCTGQLGYGYKGSQIFKVHANDHIVGGDFENNDGTGGYSIYNNKGYFLADDSGLKDEVGAVRMRGMGTDDKTGAGKVGSQFHIWVGERDFRSYKRTLVIGKIIEGLDVLQKISCFKTVRHGDGFSLTKDVTIKRCGLL